MARNPQRIIILHLRFIFSKKLESFDIVLFDGYCNLCSGAVQFILKHERSPTLRFSSLQSETGNRLIGEHGIDSVTTDSIIYIEKNTAYIKSDAAIKIASHLKNPWAIISHTGFIPKVIRDFLYDVIAKNRYRLFGKKDECWLPKPDWKERFL